MDENKINNNEKLVIKEKINEPLIKEYKFPLGEEIYLIKIQMENEIFIIKAFKNDINSNIFYKNEYTLPEIYEINSKYKDYKNNKDLFNILTNDLFESSIINLKLESNYLTIINNNNNFLFKLKKCIPEDNDVIDDIFNKLSLLEEQINNFSNYEKNLTNKLKDYESDLEKIIKK